MHCVVLVADPAGGLDRTLSIFMYAWTPFFYPPTPQEGRRVLAHDDGKQARWVTHPRMETAEVMAEGAETPTPSVSTCRPLGLPIRLAWRPWSSCGGLSRACGSKGPRRGTNSPGQAPRPQPRTRQPAQPTARSGLPKKLDVISGPSAPPPFGTRAGLMRRCGTRYGRD